MEYQRIPNTSISIASCLEFTIMNTWESSSPYDPDTNTLFYFRSGFFRVPTISTAKPAAFARAKVRFS